MSKMNKNWLIFLPLVLLLLVWGLVWEKKDKGALKTTGFPSVSRPTPTPFLGEGEFKILPQPEIAGVLPVKIQLKTGPTPQNQGIVGAKVVLTYPAALLALDQEAIIPVLPPPWQFVHKEIREETITLDAIYLGPQGYFPTGGEFSDFALLNFKILKRGAPNFSVIKEKSGLFSKKDNLNILKP